MYTCTWRTGNPSTAFHKQTGSQKRPKIKPPPHGYFEVTHTPVLWRHITRPISFSLVLDLFCVKYIDKADTDHLIAALEKHWKIYEDCTGGLYCGIDLKWD